ncbi:MAG: putative porin [Bacteroidetes bacterium]|nr:putative porin [Bacteroidota bacterium]
MLKAKFIFILLCFLIFIPTIIFGQSRDEFRMEGEPGMEEETNLETKKNEMDSRIGMWNMKGYGAFQDSITLDTTLDIFHLYHPVYKEVLTASYLGNFGNPYLNNDFFGRESNVDFLFVKSREAYLLIPATIEYYNTTTPFTRLEFSQSENKARKSEQRFNVLHSQNASPYLNFTFRFDQAKSVGQYNDQKSSNNFVTLYSSYNKDNWNIYSGFISNSIKSEENGGLTDETTILEPEATEYLNVNLNASKSSFNSTYFFNNSEYQIGEYIEINDSLEYFRPIVGLMYSFQYERHKQEFLEEEENDTLFWDNSWYGDDYINDSICFNKLSNTFQIKQYENGNRKVSFGKRAFLGHEFVRGSTPGINAELSNRQEIKYSNLFVGGGIFRQTGKFWNWNFDGKIYLLGRNIGQTELNGTISKPITFFSDSLAALVFGGSIENLVADPFQEEFYSNHIKWDNNFNMEQRMTADGKFVSEKRKLKIGAKYAIINNFIYNDTLGIPTQTNKELIVLSAYLDKDFNYRKLHFRTRLLWQKASNQDLVHLPDLSAFVSTYFQFVVSKVLYTQIGADARYNTKYYADAYAPSTGLFHLQNKKKYGNFPYMDVYVNARLKRTTIFFNLMNIGTNFINREYITTPTYPMNRSTYRFGVSWAFYD